MDIRELLQFNINYLIFLDSLIRNKSVTKAAEECFVSQPAMSYALQKLRDYLNDPLLVKNGNSFELSTFAQKIEPEISFLLGRIYMLANEKKDFDPSSHDARFHILTMDYVEMLLAPKIVDVLSPYPNLSLSFDVWTSAQYAQTLESGDSFFAISYFPELPPSLNSFVLFEDEFICLARKDHPQISGSLDLKTFTNLKHIMILEDAGSYPFVNKALSALNVSRDIGYYSPHFLASPHIVESTDMVITFPKRIYEAFFKHLNLAAWPLPFELEKPQMKCIWHSVWDEKPSHKWFREQLENLDPG